MRLMTFWSVIWPVGEVMRCSDSQAAKASLKTRVLSARSRRSAVPPAAGKGPRRALVRDSSGMKEERFMTCCMNVESADKSIAELEVEEDAGAAFDLESFCRGESISSFCSCIRA